MSKTVWLCSISLLTLSAAVASLSSSVSETAAGPRSYPAQQVSLSDIQRKADVKSMPAMEMNDMTFVFADTECGMNTTQSNLGLCTIGSTGGRW
jgi:hypothetical protein